jgi:hypothetical protein
MFEYIVPERNPVQAQFRNYEFRIDGINLKSIEPTILLGIA